MKKTVMLLFCLFFIVMVFASIRVDLKLRSDDFYADTGMEIGYPDPTWEYRGALMTDRGDRHYKHDSNNNSYGSGAWYNQPLEVFYDLSDFLVNSDNVYEFGYLGINLIGWEDDNGSAYNYDDGDDNFEYGWEFYNIFDYEQGIWQDINDAGYVDIGSHADNNKYRMEVDVWWQYTLPGLIEGQTSVVDANSVLLTKTNNNDYQIDSWDYEVSSDDFTNIIYSGTSSEESLVIDGIDATSAYYFRIRGTNNTGSGEFNQVPCYLPLPGLIEGQTSIIDINTILLTKTNNNNYQIDSWDYEVSSTEDFSNMLYSGTSSEESLVIENCNVFDDCYFRIRGLNSSGYGAFNNVEYNHLEYPSFTVDKLDSKSIEVVYQTGCELISSWDCQVSSDLGFNDIVSDVSYIDENQQTITDLDFDSIYYIRTRPRDDQALGPWSSIDSIKVLWQGQGSEESPFLVKNIYDLQNIAFNVDYLESSYLQTNDIDASITNSWNDGAGFIPIGNFSDKFEGYYDGQGFSINSLYINRDGDEIGLFAWASNCTLTNINLLDVNITGIDKVASLVAFITYSDVTDCNVNGSVSGNSFTGALAAYLVDVCMVDCSSSVDIEASGQHSGGLGKILYSTVSNCNFSGNIVGQSCTGGFAGTVASCNIDSCYTECLVTGTSHVGGFAGIIDHHNSDLQYTVSNCYSNSVTTGNTSIGGFVGYCAGGNSIENCYATGTLSADDYYGGFAGKTASCIIYNSYTSVEMQNSNGDDHGFIGYIRYDYDPVLENNFYSIEETGQNEALGASGLTLVQMHNPLTFINAGWDYLDESENGSNSIWAFEPYQNPRLSFEDAAFITDYDLIPNQVEYEVNKLDNTSISIELSDSHGYEVTNWDYQISSDTLFNNIIALGNSSEESILVENLPALNETEYYCYRFNSKNDYGESGFSDVVFAIPNNVEASLSSLENGDIRIERIVAGNYRIDGWEYEIARNITFDDIIVAGSSTSVYIDVDNLPELNEDEYYSCRIRCFNESGMGEYSQAVYFVPQELEVKMYEVESSSLKILVESTNNYKVDQVEYQLSLDSSFSNIIYSTTSISNQIIVEDIDVNNRYYLRYKSSNTYGESDFYQSHYALPADIESHIAIVDDNNLRINITDKNDFRLTSWDYQLSLDEAFTSIVAQQTAINDSTVLVEGIDASQYYYSRIITRNEDGQSDYQSSNYLSPFGVVFDATVIDSNSLKIEKINNNGYLVTSWNVKLFLNGEYDSEYDVNNISENSIIIEDINTDSDLIVYTQCKNEDNESNWELSNHLIPNVFINYKIRTDDFYANVSVEIGNPDPTWTYDCSFGDGVWLGENVCHDNGSHFYGSGAWYEQDLNEVWSGSQLIDDTSLFLKLSCWEDDRGSETSYDDGDDDYVVGLVQIDDILSYNPFEWNRIAEDNETYLDVGSVQANNYYRIEFDYYWEYTIPSNYIASINATDSETIVISKNDSGEYRVLGWDYQLSTDEEFSNIVAEGSDLSGDTYTISNIDTQQSYYLRLREYNETGYGQYCLATYSGESDIPLMTPSNIEITNNQGSWHISWEQIDNASQYLIESSSDLVDWQEEGVTQETSFTIQDVRNQARFFRVIAR